MPSTHRRRVRRRPLGAAVAVAALVASAVLLGPASADPASTGQSSRTPTSTDAVQATRPMENLDRGVVAVRSSETDVFVSWRLLGLDPEDIGFHVERATGDGDWKRINDDVLTGGTNFEDSEADLSEENRYRVVPVVDGEVQEPSGAFTLDADHAEEPVVRVPLRDGDQIKFSWVGDLTGDGEYDYLVLRNAPRPGQKLEAYASDGEFLWEVDMGPNSSDSGSATLGTGHWDGATVYDFDSDGTAEVAVRVADGVTFGDGSVHSEEDDVHQSIAILDGETGAPRATGPVPDDYIETGPMNARFAVGYLDGTTPSLVAYQKNRKSDGSFNLVISAWNFEGKDLTRQWKWLRGNQDAADGHNTRVIDVDGDGDDEVAEIGFVLDGDGTMLYSLADQGVVHGDRFHIADMDPDRPGLEGYGVQQNQADGLREYYYDASDGTMLWQHVEDGEGDVGRGMAGDIDSRHPGMEAWSFSGLYNAPTDELIQDPDDAPWPELGIWWDGDPMLELLSDGKFENWAPDGSQRQLTTWHYGATNVGQGNPTMVGDVFGDWREEALYVNGDHNELIIFTTDHATDTRLYTLPHNPGYRNDMTVKGYMQSHHVDYFIGDGMEQPPRPDISYVEASAD
ncbi:hypothetical protein LHJ74_16870 [Streptomyces sp. N2-109]|uniref:Rhamnogalacturonan I lyase beta-sheet domain-containing protein n=1 Tax=Streptomyces gossypii TaxID=2883101 RepID=A0ABT2JW45_9ACTN|nr:hypothetical protein [Streptomyces gossypii]MCT2591550.1 hypothetical protein [Streptomyces gossypii]